MSLEDYNLTTAVVPVCKWTFPQDYNGRTITITAASGSSLVTEVENFRINQGMEVGDVEFEVAQYIGNASPENVRLGLRLRNIPTRPTQKFYPLIERIKRWFVAVLPLRIKFCDQKDAEDRAVVCLGCPQNVSWQVTGCGRCNEDINERAVIFRAGSKTKLDLTLKGCRIYGAELRCLVHFDVDALPKPNDKAPSNCWINKTA